MESLIHADIFFYVTTIIVILIGFIFAVCLGFLIKILKDASDISRRVRDETEQVVSDIHTVRQSVKNKAKWSAILGFVAGFFRGRKMGRTSSKIKNHNQ